MATLEELERDGGSIYTLDAIRQVSEEMARSAAAEQERTLRLLFPNGLPPRKPLTRRQRMRARWFDYRERVRLAIEALRGDHDCGSW